MQPLKATETPEHQEARAQSRMRPKAALITAAILAVYFLIFSRGWPWLGTSFFEAVVGRVTGLPWAANIALHLAACVAYSLVIGLAVYRFNPFLAAFVGIATGCVLYGANYAIAQMTGGLNPAEEGGIWMAHVFFGLFGALMYKAFSVPPPRGVRPEARVS